MVSLNKVATPATAAALHVMADRIVREDVRYCVSGLISALMTTGALENGAIIDEDDAIKLAYRAPDADDYRDAAPHDVDVSNDGEEGWTIHAGGQRADDAWYPTELAAWDALFDSEGLDKPDGSEIYEHWLVTDDLARRLEALGESVAHDLQGLTVWGRATTGQGIAMDSVIQRIARDILEA